MNARPEPLLSACVGPTPAEGPGGGACSAAPGAGGVGFSGGADDDPPSAAPRAGLAPGSEPGGDWIGMDRSHWPTGVWFRGAGRRLQISLTVKRAWTRLKPAARPRATERGTSMRLGPRVNARLRR